MTTADILGALRRCWYIVVAGLLAIGFALSLIAAHPGVYWSQVDVVFLAPQSTDYPNSLASTSTSLIATAGLVEHHVNIGVSVPATASSGVALIGRGVRDGYQIQLPNSGGQWTNNFDRPVLDIQVVGASESEVRQRLQVLVSKVDDTLADLQDRDNVAPEVRIRTQSAPNLASVFYAAGLPRRAMAVAAFLGLTLTITAAVSVDRLRSRRRRRAQDDSHAVAAEPRESLLV